MARTFNMGIGMILVVPDYAVMDIMQRIEAMNERAYIIGEILDCKEAGKRLVWE
jgi:phosphoribosylformylglycinamidine cyclo-ligase